jgi:hypothetical protein
MYDRCTALDGLLTPYLVLAIRSQICLCSGHINGGQHVAYLTCSITIAVYEGKLKLYRVNLL